MNSVPNKVSIYNSDIVIQILDINELISKSRHYD